jgi:hypothetical protein
MARKKKKTASEIPVEVTVAAVTVTDVDSSCCCGHVFQKQLCDLNLELGVERFCVEKEESSISTGAEAIAAATELEAGIETEAEAAIGATAAAKEDCCCELFRKLNISLLEAYSCLERTTASEGVGGEAGATGEAAIGEAAGAEAAVVTESEGSCQCRNDLEKYWCEEYLKMGMGRRCIELRRLLENKDSEDNTGTVNHFKIIWHKDSVL